MNFNELKKNRGAALKALQKELDEASGKKKSSDAYKDKRFWEPSVDKAGNGGAVIRFLPCKSHDVPFVKVWSHGFQGPTGQWYFENSRTTLGEDDPVSEYNTKLWNSGNKDQARDQKRKLHFICNILVVKDPGNKENNGKVFLFKFGKMIFDKIDQAQNPPQDDEGRSPEHEDYDPQDTVNAFDMWDGANFRIIISKKERFRTYELSKFDNPSPVSDDDDEIEDIYNQTMDISEFVDEKNFKPYDQLKARLNTVMGFDEDELEKKPSKMEDSEPEIPSSDDGDDDDIDLDMLMKELD